MKSLADGVEFDDAETFTEKLNTLKKTYFPSESEKEEVVAEEGTNGSSEVMTDAMKKIVASLSNQREPSVLGA